MEKMKPPDFKNTLMYGDNLGIMAGMASNWVDLIYLDPPFNSKRDYHAIYEFESGIKLPEQVAAFHDMWEYDSSSQEAFDRIPMKMAEYGIDDDSMQSWAYMIKGLRKRNESLAAYLIYMTERLLEMHRILKDTGSIYLHCDPVANSYLRMIMDIIFGHNNFRNEIVWRIGWVSGYKTQKKGWIRNHDTILYYVKSPKAQELFNKEYIPYPKGYVRRDGKPPSGKGVPIEDTWNCSNLDSLDSIMIKSFSKEKTGYPTQKPCDLLLRIIKASSVEGDIVFDPFCGCATTMEAAHLLGRNWIGIDITIFAIRRVANKRLAKLGLKALKTGKAAEKEYESGKHYFVDGIPNSMESARDLWNKDPYQFQKWGVESIGGFANPKKTGDGGVDGRLYFKEGRKDIRSMVLEVKGGQGKNVSTDVVNKLITAMQNNSAEMAGLIHLEPLSDQMKKKHKATMAKQGFVEIEGNKYPKVQMLSIEEMLKGKTFNTPPVQVDKLMSQIEGFGLDV